MTEAEYITECIRIQRDRDYYEELTNAVVRAVLALI